MQWNAAIEKLGLSERGLVEHPFHMVKSRFKHRKHYAVESARCLEQSGYRQKTSAGHEMSDSPANPRKPAQRSH
jgi:hypothetical protein